MRSGSPSMLSVLRAATTVPMISPMTILFFATCRIFAPGHPFDGGQGCPVPCHDVALLPAQVDTPEAAECLHLKNVDFGGFLGFIGGKGGIPSGFDFQHIERLPGENHVAVTHPVNQLSLVGVNIADDLAGYDARLEALVFGTSQRFQDGCTGGARLRLAARMDFQQSVEALDDLHSGAHA